MIKEAKDLIQSIIPEALVKKVVRDGIEEKKALSNKELPFLALITNPGGFDETEAKYIKFKEDGALFQRYIRGTRTLPIVIRVWAESEDEADEILSEIIVQMPRFWNCDGLQGRVDILNEEHSDYSTRLLGKYLSALEISFSVEVGKEKEQIQTFNSVLTEG